MTIAELEKLLQQPSYRPKADHVQSIIEQDPERLLPYLTERFIAATPEGASITGMVWGNIARAHPAWIQPYQERIYRASVANRSPGIRRNGLRYFSEIPVLLAGEQSVPTWAQKKDFLYYRSSKPYNQPATAFVEPELEGLLLDHVLEVIADPREVAAPKAFGIQLLTNLALKYPEISHESIPVIKEAMRNGTPGVKHRGGRAIPLMERLIDEPE